MATVLAELIFWLILGFVELCRSVTQKRKANWPEKPKFNKIHDFIDSQKTKRQQKQEQRRDKRRNRKQEKNLKGPKGDD